jgi:hypothetical protein
MYFGHDDVINRGKIFIFLRINLRLSKLILGHLIEISAKIQQINRKENCFSF